MDTARKKKLITYLYPNKHILEFMYNDFYVELYKILPRKICFSNDNLKNENRNNNYKKAINILKNFFNENIVYYNKLKELYPYKHLDYIIKDVLAGYILFLTPNINKNTGADVYSDRRSICYSKISILDIDII